MNSVRAKKRMFIHHKSSLVLFPSGAVTVSIASIENAQGDTYKGAFPWDSLKGNKRESATIRVTYPVSVEKSTSSHNCLNKNAALSRKMREDGTPKKSREVTKEKLSSVHCVHKIVSLKKVPFKKKTISSPMFPLKKDKVPLKKATFFQHFP